MIFSLSTSWNSSRHKNGYDLVEEIKEIGFDTIELNFSLTKNIVDDILSIKKNSAIKISSLHNICPLPKEIEPNEASPDYHSLSSPNEEERSLAITVTKNTIHYASMLDAKAVILHIGRVEIKDKIRDLTALIDDKKEYNALKDAMIREREEMKDGYLKNAMLSLNELIPYAKERKVCLAIENRYYYREIPLPDELEEIFENFNIKDLFYWHDVGHAEVFERLGLARHIDFLERFQNRLIGVHLHDIIGLINDHKAPGFGTFDFKILKPFLKEDTIKVIEAHKPASANDIRRSVEYLTKVLG